MKCIACGEKGLKLSLKMKNVPPLTQVVMRKVQQFNRKHTLFIYECQRCTLLQLPKESELKKSYYEDYLIDRTYSHFANEYQKKAASDFVRRYGLKGKSILEVGCGDGFFAKLLQKEGARVIGIDPSEAACRQTRKKGVKAICKYIDNNLKLNKNFYAFTACQVLEHMIDPRQFLTIIRSLLYPGGYGFIEVPSLAKTLEEKRFHDFFPDHVAYYNTVSLSYLLIHTGFDILDIHQSVNNEFLTVVVKANSAKQKISTLQNEFINFEKSAKIFFKSIKNKKVIAWGAGIRGISLLSYSGVSPKTMKYCIDSDPEKRGLFLPGVDLEVVGPDVLLKQDYDVVIISATLYTDEIVKTLRKKYKYRNRIAVLFPKPKFI